MKTREGGRKEKEKGNGGKREKGDTTRGMQTGEGRKEARKVGPGLKKEGERRREKREGRFKMEREKEGRPKKVG